MKSRVAEIAPPLNAAPLKMQRVGGGFCAIPAWFADQYTGGRRLGVGCGGYLSGQASSLGPTLAAASLQGGRLDSLKLMEFAWTSASKSHRERRPGDYQDYRKHVFQPKWMVPSDPGGEGYWFTSRIGGNPAWIDEPHVHGHMVFVRQGYGDFWYRSQGQRGWENFTKTNRNMVYVYDPKQFAEVAQKQRPVWAVRGQYDVWHKMRGGVGGAHWDAGIEVVVCHVYPGSQVQLEDQRSVPGHCRLSPARR